MGILDELKRHIYGDPQQTPPPATGKTGEALSFVLEEHYRGFKAFPIVTHGYEEAEKNNDKLAGEKLPGKTISFIPGKYDGNKKMYSVVIDGLKIGAVFDSGIMERISKITNVYARMDEETVITNSGTITRSRIHLFTKDN